MEATKLINRNETLKRQLADKGYRQVKISIGTDRAISYLDAEDAWGALGRAGGDLYLFLRPNPRRTTLLHEMGHLFDCSTMSKVQFKNMPPMIKELRMELFVRNAFELTADESEAFFRRRRYWLKQSKRGIDSKYFEFLEDMAGLTMHANSNWEKELIADYVVNRWGG